MMPPTAQEQMMPSTAQEQMIPSTAQEQMMPSTGAPYQLFVGIDIAADTAMCCCLRDGESPRPSFSITQSPDGIASLTEQIAKLHDDPATTLIVLEATGSYWMTLATKLYDLGYAISVINPAQAHHFAKALLKRAKTDKIDAQTLARLAERLQPEPWSPQPDVYHEIRQRLTHRDQLLHLRTQVRNEIHALSQQPVVIAAVQEHQHALIATFNDQIKTVDAALLQAFHQDAEWDAAFTRLQTIPGIGSVTAAWLIVATTNFTTDATVEQLTAYAGLAPMPHTSGRSVRKREQIGHSGNKRLRTALYMATLSACRYNPVIRPFYKRLLAKGKPTKVARCAAARKLLHLARAVVVNKRDFDPTYAHKVEASREDAHAQPDMELDLVA